MKPVRLDFLVKYLAFDIYWSYFNERAPSLSVVCFIFWCRCAFVFRIKTKWGGGGGNWLRLGGGDDDGGLDLNNVLRETSRPFPRERKGLTKHARCIHFFRSLWQVACIALLFLISSFLTTIVCYVVSRSSAPPERQERQASPPRRAGRRQGDGDNDEFLRMLGITLDEPPKPNQVDSADDSSKKVF